MGQLKVIEGGGEVAVTTRLSDLLQWARKWSLFQYPFVTACCGMEFMATAAPRYDIARFGAEAPRFSPRQSDVLWVVGTISQRQGPVIRRIWEQMADPKWVIAFGTCASCGGFYDNYTTIPGVDKVSRTMTRTTRRITVGDVAVGGGAPVSVQSMCNTDTRDLAATLDVLQLSHWSAPFLQA